MLNSLGLSYSFCRIQSTACEQQKFEQMMNEVDSAMLMHIAAGHWCVMAAYGPLRPMHFGNRFTGVANVCCPMCCIIPLYD